MNKHRRKHHVTTFMELPRHRRRQMVHYEKIQIEKAYPLHRGLFYSYDYIHGKNGYADIYFLSKKDKFVFYNVTLLTLKSDYKDKCFDLAYDLSEKCVADNDCTFEKCLDGMGSIMKWRFRHDQPHWDGLPWNDFMDREMKRLADSGEILVKPRIEQDWGYARGIGLHAYLPHDGLSIDNICEFIEGYWRAGEPRVIEYAQEYSYRWDELNDYAHNINQICDPQEQMRALAERDAEESSSCERDSSA